MKIRKISRMFVLIMAINSTNIILPYGVKAGGQVQWKLINNNWYYYDSNGKAKAGWINDKGNWYYLYSSGIMAKSSWIQSEGKWYYLGENGAMVYNRVVDNCKIGSKGYWIPNVKESFSKIDLRQELDNFSFCGFYNLDSEKQKKYIKNTINVTQNELNTIENIVVNLAQSMYSEEQVKEKLIGMTTEDNKYVITNVYMTKVRYKKDAGEQNEILDSSNVFDYKPQSKYYFDIGRLLDYGYRYNFDWGVYRFVLEFEEL